MHLCYVDCVSAGVSFGLASSLMVNCRFIGFLLYKGLSNVVFVFVKYKVNVYTHCDSPLDGPGELSRLVEIIGWKR